MNVVVADTSPINYLLLIDEIEVLSLLFKQILIPDAVAAELRRSSAPAVVRRWMQSPPSWLSERTVTVSSRVYLAELDAGETEAIQLALDAGADLVLMDEVKGRAVAKQMNLAVRGTVGILIQAATSGLVDLPNVVARLERTNFYMDSTLRAAIAQFSHPRDPP